MLKGVEETARETHRLVEGISQLMKEYKEKLRPVFKKLYRHELLNELFFHPYTKVKHLEDDLQISRQTATKYLNMMVEAGVVKKVKSGRSNYFINEKLVQLFIEQGKP